jgi:hypothetical protein
MIHVEKKLTFDTPLDTVIDFAKDPKHLNAWFVNLGELDEIKGKGEVNTTVKTAYFFAGMRYPMTIKVEQLNIAPREIQWNLAFTGPVAGNLITFFKTLPNNTIEAKFDLRLNLPENIITKVGGVPTATHLLDLAVAYTLENLKTFAGAEVKAAVPV